MYPSSCCCCGGACLLNASHYLFHYSYAVINCHSSLRLLGCSQRCIMPLTHSLTDGRRRCQRRTAAASSGAYITYYMLTCTFNCASLDTVVARTVASPSTVFSDVLHSVLYHFKKLCLFVLFLYILIRKRTSLAKRVLAKTILTSQLLTSRHMACCPFSQA